MSRRSLIEKVDRLPSRTFARTVFRNVAPGYPAISGEGARRFGGRWNPPKSFPVLYTASGPETAALEVRRTATKLGVREGSLLPRNLISLDVSLGRVLDFTDSEVLHQAGLTEQVLVDDDVRICQALGDAAHYLGYEGVLSPSAAGPGDTLAIFLNRLRATSRLESVRIELLEAGDLT